MHALLHSRYIWNHGRWGSRPPRRASEIPRFKKMGSCVPSPPKELYTLKSATQNVKLPQCELLNLLVVGRWAQRAPICEVGSASHLWEVGLPSPPCRQAKRNAQLLQCELLDLVGIGWWTRRAPIWEVSSASPPWEVGSQSPPCRQANQNMKLQQCELLNFVGVGRSALRAPVCTFQITCLVIDYPTEEPHSTAKWARLGWGRLG